MTHYICERCKRPVNVTLIPGFGWAVCACGGRAYPRTNWRLVVALVVPVLVVIITAVLYEGAR